MKRFVFSVLMCLGVFVTAGFRMEPCQETVSYTDVKLSEDLENECLRQVFSHTSQQPDQAVFETKVSNPTQEDVLFVPEFHAIVEIRNEDGTSEEKEIPARIVQCSGAAAEQNRTAFCIPAGSSCSLLLKVSADADIIQEITCTGCRFLPVAGA